VAHRACILGCQGQSLTVEERAFFRDVRPWGFILFARNVGDLDQLRALTDSLREAVQDEATLVFVDQEGGRVQRLRPPLARLRPPAGRFGELYAKDPAVGLEAVFLNHRLIAAELAAGGIDADCVPCLDIRHPGAHSVIGERAFGEDAACVSALGRAALDGLLAGGVAPVIKHMPGHGRATSDSHLETPRVTTPLAVLEATDFEPFRALADAPMGMTGHITFPEVDPEASTTQSRHVIQTIIRGWIGFDGLLMTDDLSMKALGGDHAERTRRAIRAGCDVALYGNGALVGEPVRDLMGEITQVAEAAGDLSGDAIRRAADARAAARATRPFDFDAAQARLDELGLGGRPAA
jgi:beta-N-acetylhexosaminidase